MRSEYAHSLELRVQQVNCSDAHGRGSQATRQTPPTALSLLATALPPLLSPPILLRPAPGLISITCLHKPTLQGQPELKALSLRHTAPLLSCNNKAPRVYGPFQEASLSITQLHLPNKAWRSEHQIVLTHSLRDKPWETQRGYMACQKSQLASDKDRTRIRDLMEKSRILCRFTLILQSSIYATDGALKDINW